MLERHDFIIQQQEKFITEEKKKYPYMTNDTANIMRYAYHVAADLMAGEFYNRGVDDQIFSVKRALGM